MDIKIYKKKLLSFSMYFLASLPILLLFFNKKAYSFSELNGANVILAVISTAICLLYYEVSKTNHLYLYTLVYLSIFLEIITNKFLFTMGILPPMPFAEFMLRTGILALILYDNNIIFTLVTKNKIISTILYFSLDVLFILLDNFLKTRVDISLIFNICAVSSYYIIFKLALKSYNQKDFIHTIYIITLIILGSKLFIGILCLLFPITPGIEDDKIYFFSAFTSLIIGLFVEFRYLILENNRLNSNVKEISNDMEYLKETSRLKTEFFANMSHELKTPINVISSSIQLLDTFNNSNLETLGKTYLKYSAVMKQNCWRLIKLTNNIIDLTKANSSFMDIELHNYDVVLIIEETVMAAADFLDNTSKHINLTFDTLIEEAYIKCNYTSIERIILNLLANSIKYSKEDGNIFVDISSDDDFIEITVTDDGCGIPDDKKNYIFEPFSKNDKSFTRLQEGIGLGLSIVKSLVDLHNGEISFTSSSNGTEFKIKLENKRIDYEDDIIIYSLSEFDSELSSRIRIEFSDIYDLY